MENDQDNRTPEIIERDRQWQNAINPGSAGTLCGDLTATPEKYASYRAVAEEARHEDVAYWGSRETKWAKRKRKLKKAEARVARLKEKLIDRDNEISRLHSASSDRINELSDFHDLLFKANEQLSALIDMVDRLGQHEVALSDAVALRQEIQSRLDNEPCF